MMKVKNLVKTAIKFAPIVYPIVSKVIKSKKTTYAKKAVLLNRTFFSNEVLSIHNLLCQSLAIWK